jgi:dTDP-4-dehydrorhamnose 3,5-epimerase
VVVVEPTVHRDQRGFFLETYRRRDYEAAGISGEFVQDNHSRSTRGVLRGIHFQDLRAPMAKLVRCSSGDILDVVVDLRVGSPTFGRWHAEEMSAETMSEIFVPVGFGHAFLTLSEVADVEYKCTGYYDAVAEGVVRWDDDELAITWPIRDPVVSGRDRHGMTLREYAAHPAFRMSPSGAKQ